jgi:hypothetical protein
MKAFLENVRNLLLLIVTTHSKDKESL